MLMCRVYVDLQACWMAAGVLVVFERVQGCVDDSGSLLFWVQVCPAMSGQSRRVEEEIDWGHVDFNELLLQKVKVFLQTHSKEKYYIENTKNLLWQVLVYCNCGPWSAFHFELLMHAAPSTGLFLYYILKLTFWDLLILISASSQALWKKKTSLNSVQNLSFFLKIKKYFIKSSVHQI